MPPAGPDTAGPLLLRFPLLVLSLLLVLALCAAARAQDVREATCSGSPLRITYSVEVDRERACEAWRRVAGFLIVERNLRVTGPIALAFAERVEIDLGAERARVLGHYDRVRRIVRITSAEAAWLREPDRLLFSLPIDAELHTSLIAHELAHAVLLDNFRVAVPGRTCGEYMAYVVQIATMAPATRERVLAAYPAGDFDSPARITEVCHLMNPHGFGVRAFRHFVREGHRYMLDQILSGQVGTDLPPL